MNKWFSSNLTLGNSQIHFSDVYELVAVWQSYEFFIILVHNLLSRLIPFMCIKYIKWLNYLYIGNSWLQVSFITFNCFDKCILWWQYCSWLLCTSFYCNKHDLVCWGKLCVLWFLQEWLQIIVDNIHRTAMKNSFTAGNEKTYLPYLKD